MKSLKGYSKLLVDEKNSPQAIFDCQKEECLLVVLEVLWLFNQNEIEMHDLVE